MFTQCNNAIFLLFNSLDMLRLYPVGHELKNSNNFYNVRLIARGQKSWEQGPTWPHQQ